MMTSIPEDVLIQIFLFLSRDHDTANGQSTGTYVLHDRGLNVDWDWLRVCKVCRYWRTVAMDTPMLWSYLDVRTLRSAKRTEAFLMRSREADLSVEYMVRCSQIGALRRVLKEMRRIRCLVVELRFGSAEEGVGVLRMLEQPAPRLRRIKLDMSSCPLKPPFTFPVASPGVLEEVDLHSWNLSSELGPGLSLLSRLGLGLRSLTIKYCGGLTLSELFGVLETCPRLSSLCIVARDIRPSSIQKSVCLPCLVSTHLDFARFPDFYDLLSNIEAQNLKRWKVGCKEKLTLEDVAKLDVLSRLMHWQKKCEFTNTSIISSRSSRRDKTMINVVVNEECSALRSTGAGVTLELPFDPADFDRAFWRVAFIFSMHLEKAEKVRIQDMEDLLMVESWCAVFVMASSAKVVEVEFGLVRDPGREESDGLRCLMALTPETDYTRGIDELEREIDEIPFPAMDHVVIKWYGQESGLGHFVAGLVDMLKARAMRGVGVKTLTVYSVFIPRDGGQLEVLKPWVEEMRWCQ